jgi:hypothetical protein
LQRQGKLWLIIIDKALIGVLLLLVGYWINRELQECKIGLEEGVDTRVRKTEGSDPSGIGCAVTS